MKKGVHQTVLALIILFITFSTCHASELVIGTRAKPTLDPHLLNDGVNNSVAAHWSGALTGKNEASRITPGLASSWEAVDDITWRFNLRKGVQFHDGSDFTAEDVIASYDRIRKLKTFATTLVGVSAIESPDPYTLIFRMEKPNPLLPEQLFEAFILPKEVAETPESSDFETGKATVGTGPYKLTEYVKGKHLIFERNEHYWGEKPAYAKAKYVFFDNDEARIAALMGGRVDMINYVPSTEVARLKSKGFEIVKSASGRVIYLVFDNSRDKAPYVSGNDGKPLAQNPYKDIRVRQAITKAIYRKFLLQQVMGGFAVEADQLVGKGAFGHNPDLKNPPFDPAGAKKLLAEAGYANGFKLTLHGPNNRYINDGPICENIAKMLKKIGLDAKAETMPKKDFFSRMKSPRNEFSFYLIGWAGSTEGLFLEQLHTYDAGRSMGVYNGGHSNPDFDKLVEDAAATIDEGERERKLKEAMKMLIENYEVIPLHSQVNLFAMKKGVSFQPRFDGWTLAASAKPAE